MVTHVGLHVVHRDQQRLGMWQQRGTRWRQLDTPGRTLQQHGLEAMLEQCHATARCGQADVGGLGGFGQAAQFGGANEQSQGVVVRQHF